MIKFNPNNKEKLTYGEALTPAMQIVDQLEADKYLRDYVSYIEKWLKREPRDDNATGEQIAKVNLGYYAGYYDDETRRRVEKLFKCSHPIFGRIEDHVPTPEEAFNAGLKMANRSSEQSAKEDSP